MNNNTDTKKITEMKQLSSMNEFELLEFGIYHYVLGRGAQIPGLLSSGAPNPEYFKTQTNNKGISKSIGQVTEWLESKLTRWWENIDSTPLILCSGGVDSSALVATIAGSNRDYKLLHTAYKEHDNNDLSKLCTLLESFPSEAYVISIAEDNYRSGLERLWQHQLPQNTYGPTMAHALSTAPWNDLKFLVTGSGPDELFYGMEKYSFEKFDSLTEVPLSEALEQLDTAYNLDAYQSVLNSSGLEVLHEIIKKRQNLYNEVASLSTSIYDAQRLLAYSTITSQHIQMYDELAQINTMQHHAPFMDPELLQIVFSIPLQQLVTPTQDKSYVEIGKHHLKKFLANYMQKEHVWSKKIGFHAPTTHFMCSKSFQEYFENITNSSLPDLFDMDKLRLLLHQRLDDHNKGRQTDYFLYSILNLAEYTQRKNRAN